MSWSLYSLISFYCSYWHQTENTEMNFIGAAQQPFRTFLELARSMMDNYCHNWNNPLDPRSYILPPVCSFKNVDKSDGDIEKLKIDLEQQKQGGVPQKLLDQIQRPIIDRCSDSGEFTVFYALWALIQDKTVATLLALHGLNLKNMESYLKHIFLDAQVDIRKEFQPMMREYDFVLIGPKIGLIVIEVKSSHFTKASDFTEKNKHLPEDIIKGLKQLTSFDPSFFQACSGMQTTQEIPIRKILFTPNLKKDRFDTWINKLDDAARKQVMDKSDGLTHWFSEDMDNKCSLKPPLYNTIREEFEKTGYQIPHEIFESYGLIISGLSSAVVLQSQKAVSTDHDRLSTSSAILKNSLALESQNPKGQRLDQNASEVVDLDSKLLLLTPEQQKALNGPNRQFIIGAPGTGKTIILQAKIAQLLKEGKKVCVYAEVPYYKKYKKLFGTHGSCKVRVANQRPSYFPQLTEEFLEKIMSDDGTLRETLEKLSKHIFGASMVRGDLRSFDSIFIDDAFDKSSSGPDWKSRRIYESLFLMAIANSNSKFRSKLVWIACDSYLNDSDGETYKRILNEIIRGEQGEDYFSTAILDRVMRSSETVFQAIYSTEVIEHLAKEPVVGHKIHGFYDSVHLGNLSLHDTLLEIWNHAYNAVKKFKEDGFGYEHMAILIGREQLEFPDLNGYLLDKFRKNGIPVGYNEAAWYVPGFLTLDEWSNVSSFEWPVVIYIGMFVPHEKRAFAAYNRYRACSRATMNLFEIIADVETVPY